MRQGFFGVFKGRKKSVKRTGCIELRLKCLRHLGDFRLFAMLTMLQSPSRRCFASAAVESRSAPPRGVEIDLERHIFGMCGVLVKFKLLAEV